MHLCLVILIKGTSNYWKMVFVKDIGFKFNVTHILDLRHAITKPKALETDNEKVSKWLAGCKHVITIKLKPAVLFSLC